MADKGQGGEDGAYKRYRKGAASMKDLDVRKNILTCGKKLLSYGNNTYFSIYVVSTRSVSTY